MTAFRIPGSYQLLIQPMNLSMLFSWQSLALTVLAFLSFMHWRDLIPFLRLWPEAVCSPSAFSSFFYLDQVLGWGYRFFYGVLGNLVLLAVAGWFYLKESLGLRKAWGFFVLEHGSGAIGPVPSPLPASREFYSAFCPVGPIFKSLPVSFVIIDPAETWYAQLLVRNDPFLRNHPKIMFSQYLDEKQIDSLRTMGEVHIMKPEELANTGLHPIISRHASR